MAVIGVLLLPSFHVSAQRKPGEFMAYGVGTKSCGKWLAERDDPSNKFINSAWVMGFVSGVGYSGAANLRETDSEAMKAWADNYCRANPLSTIADASMALVQALIEK